MRIEKLTRESFAPFGDVITLDGAQRYPINDGTTDRFHDLASWSLSSRSITPSLNGQVHGSA
jgi:ureidoglycolate lyase